jgi:GntR family transcriptional repressor for pyruvate dehydrogenase complex
LSDNPTITPVERRKTYELVADRLTVEISSRRLLPGDPVPPERELVESYAVGRSSVREALRMLESRGLIESRGSGAFAVSEFRNPLNHSLGLLLAVEEASLHELFEMRRILEGEAAALAATRRKKADVTQMRRAVKQMEDGIDSEQRYIEADLRFHLTVAEATGNRVASHLMHALRDQVQHALGTIYHIPGSPQRSLEQHRTIVDAIEARDAERARARMHEHLARVDHEINLAAGGSNGRKD